MLETTPYHHPNPRLAFSPFVPRLPGSKTNIKKLNHQCVGLNNTLYNGRCCKIHLVLNHYNVTQFQLVYWDKHDEKYCYNVNWENRQIGTCQTDFCKCVQNVTIYKFRLCQKRYKNICYGIVYCSYSGRYLYGV